MSQDADKGMKSLQQRYKDDHYKEICNAPLSFTVWQYIYLDWPTMATIPAEPQPTEFYNKLMPIKTRPFKGFVEVLQITICQQFQW